MKKNIDLIINGIAPEKVMYDTDNHSLVVLYPPQGEFKRGDIVIHDNTSRVAIFDEYEYGTNKKDFKAITSMMNISNGTYTGVTFNRHWNTDTLRMATDNEAKLLFDLLKKIGKRWNRDTLEIEDIVDEFKRGDILAFDDILLIFDEYANKERNKLHSLWNNFVKDNRNWQTKAFIHATDEQKAQVHELLKKEGKKWNAETLQVEDIKPEFKRGDIVIHDNTKRVSIFDSYKNKYWSFNAIFSIGRSGDIDYNRSWVTNTVRYATSSEIEKFDNDLKEIGKKWNAETLQVEDLDISEIVVDLESACEYLEIKRPSFFILDACERSEKFKAQITLQLIREAWNKADGFVVDWNNMVQRKYYPQVLVLDECRISAANWRTYASVDSSCYCFKSRERAKQFGTQFKELLKTAMGL